MKRRWLVIFVFVSVACLLRPPVAMAQCTLSTDVTIVQHSDCFASGVVDVTVSGSPDVVVSDIMITITDGWGVNRTVRASTYRFTDLPGGVYQVIGASYCAIPFYQSVSDTAVIHIQSDYVGTSVYPLDSRPSLNCRPTGWLQLNVLDGKPPYTIQAVSTPEGYSGRTEWTLDAPGAVEMDNLVQGVYQFIIIDSCSYSRMQDYTIYTLSSDYPYDPYYSTLQSACPSSGGCDEVLINSNGYNDEWNYYWNSHKSEFYEVAFTVNGSDTVWVPAENSHSYTLPHNYKVMRDNDYGVDVHMRVKGCSDIQENIDRIWLSSGLNVSIDSAGCTGYNVSFQPSSYDLLCFPYQWEMRDTDRNSVVGTGAGIRDCSRQAVKNLEYNRNYSLQIEDNLGTMLLFSYNITPSVAGYYDRHYCLPDTVLTSLYFRVAEPLGIMPFPVGTRFRQLSGPLTVPQPDVTLTESSYYFYPFSSNPTSSEMVKLPPGTYSFEVTLCGNTYTMNYEHGDYILEEYTYKTEEACDGLHVYPFGQFLDNGQPVGQTYYTTIEAPPEVGWYTTYEGGYFLLPVSGHYAFVRQSSDAWYTIGGDILYYTGTCAIDTIHIDYTREVFGLDSLAVYACAVGSMPLFYVKAEHGFLPYTYELYENGSFVASNNTGEFVYGSAQHNYSMIIIDSCGTNFPENLPVIDLGRSNMAVHGSDTVCVGETIRLNCISLGATAFHWEGPNGFVSGNQFATVPNATTANAGSYVLTFQPAGCVAPVTQVLDVTVYVPPPPVCDTLHCCQHATCALDGIGVLPNHSVVWFAEDSVTAISMPDINTATVHEEVFYVAQQHNVRGCIGEGRRVVIKVNALPPALPPVDTIHFCRNGSNTLPVISADAGHTLVWYEPNGVTECPPPAISTLTAYEVTCYIAQRNDRLGCVSEKTPVNFKVNEPPRLVVDTIQFCHNGSNVLPVITPAADHTVVWYAADSATVCLPPVISTATVHEERYYIVQRDNSRGCESEKAPVVIKVNALPSPLPPMNTILFCHNGDNTLPAISTDAGHTLVWYEPDGATECPPPAIATAAVHEEAYYIAQRNDRLGCVGPKEKVTIEVLELPSSNITADAAQICANISPVIDIQQTIAGYTYEIYSDAQATRLLYSITGTGGNVSVPLTVTIAVNTEFYIKVIGLNCPAATLKTVTVPVKSITISPDELPPYYFNQPYMAQLRTNITGAIYTLSGTLPAGITFTADGRFSGTVPYNSNASDRTVMVYLIDADGCVTEKEYVLQPCALKPIVPATSVSYCEGDIAVPLQASSPDNYLLCWYDAGQHGLNMPPIPSTEQTGEQRYYVSQYNVDRHCEGPLDTITVTVHSVPGLSFDAMADVVCYRTSPVITLDRLQEDYTYHIYSDPSLLHQVAEVSGVTGSAIRLDELLENNHTYFVSVSTPFRCVSADAKEVSVPVIIVTILPENLSAYRKGELYSVQLSAGDGSPVFTLAEGSLPVGLSLSLSGLLSGRVLPEEPGGPMSFAVQAETANGCTDIRRYVLPWDYFVPKVFTPNGDGINDIFMRGHRIVIFDRFGISIYEGEDGWDGTSKGKPVPSDIYFYKLTVPLVDGREEVKTGYIGLEKER
jgi:gliding motility-associated-like protein